MKKITYSLIWLMSFALFSQSCSEGENYKDMNITNYEEEIDLKEFVGDLTSDIIVKNAAGEVVDNVDMGETFYIIDNSMHGVTDRKWTITQADRTITSTDKFMRVNFIKPGPVTFSLESSRSTDGKSVSASETIDINVIPVDVNFVSQPEAVDGKVTIQLGESVSFVTEAKGSPSMFLWEAVGAETYTSEERDPFIQFKKLGAFDVSVTGTREDNPGEFVNDKETKAGYVEVIPMNMSAIGAYYDNKVIRLSFANPVMADVSGIASKLNVRIETAGGASSNATVNKVTNDEEDPATILIHIVEEMFTDDKVFISINEGLTDQFGLTPVELADHYVDYDEEMTIRWDFEDPEQRQMTKTWDNESLSYGYSTEQARSGKHSFKFEINKAGKNMGFSARKENNVWVETFALEAGTYVYTYWMYIDTEEWAGHFSSWILNAGWAWNLQCWENGGNRPMRQWFKVQKEVTLSADDMCAIQLKAPGSSAGAVYYDDFSLVLKKSR